MRREELTAKLLESMQAVRVPPSLHRQTALAAQGKEEKYMKKKIAPALVFALVAVMLCAAAIAAANRWGMLDFVSQYSAHLYIPEDAQDYVETDVAVMENEWVTAAVRELYYDGRISRVTVDVTPKEANTLLVGEDVFMEDPFVNLTNDYVMDGDNDMRPVWQVISEEGIEKVYSVSVFMKGAADDVVMGVGDYMLGEDGTLTLYSQEEYRTDMPERNVSVSVIVMPFDQPLSMDSRGNDEKAEALNMPITLEAAMLASEAAKSAASGVYVSEAPAAYPSAGVQVDRVLIEVKPQEIYAQVEYSVVDQAAYERMHGWLWFEFIDPNSTETEPWNQRLAEGLGGGRSSGAMDGERNPAMRFCQRETLGRNELRQTYTLRAYNAWGKERYETCEIRMRPATAKDMIHSTEK